MTSRKQKKIKKFAYIYDMTPTYERIRLINRLIEEHYIFDTGALATLRLDSAYFCVSNVSRYGNVILDDRLSIRSSKVLAHFADNVDTNDIEFIYYNSGMLKIGDIDG